MLSHSIKLIANIDPLKYLLSKTTLIGRLAKWVMLLSEFDIEYVDRKAIKGQVIVDQLADAPLMDDQPIHREFPDAHILALSMQTWKLYFDGSCTQQGLGAGILFVTPQGYTIPKSYKLLFPCTNNVAEYEALMIGLKMDLQWKVTELNVYRDSQLIINQVNDDYQTKDDKLLPYKCMVDDFKQYFSVITFEQIPRHDNKAINAMAMISSLFDAEDTKAHFEFLVESLTCPVYDDPDMSIICHLIGHDSQIYGKIYSYLKNDILPPYLS